MITFEEITAREDSNDDRIILYREGLFFKAYERSAYVFACRLAVLKPSKKRIKYLAREVVSVGFPTNTLLKYFPADQCVERQGRIEIPLGEPVDEAAYSQWKASLPLKEPKPKGHKSVDKAIVFDADGAPVVPVPLVPATAAAAQGAVLPLGDQIVQMIREFRLEAATPVRCLTFIAELKQRIDGDL